MKTINIKTIRINGGTQSRVEINNEIVTEYAEAIKSGVSFPPVVVFDDGADSWLADGFHRFHAHSQAGKSFIEADVRQGTLRDAKLYSFGANGRHGQRPTNADKRKAVSEILADSEWRTWSQHKIAEVCGVSAGFVSKMVSEAASIHGEQIKPPTRTVERNGKTYEQDTSSIGKVATPKPTPTLATVLVAKVAMVESETGSPSDYTELDQAHEQIQDLQAELVVARIASTDSDEQKQAAELIAELRAHIRTLEATNNAITASRDSLMNEVAQLKKQCAAQKREIDKLKS